MTKIREGYKETEIGIIPKGWEARKLGDIVRLQGGYAFKSSDFSDKGVRVVKIANVQQYNLSWEDESFLPENFVKEKSDFKLYKGDVVLAMTRPIISTGVKVCKVKESDLPSLLNQRVGRFLIQDSIDQDFLFQLCFTKRFIDGVKLLSNTTGQPNISSKQVETIIMPIPTLREQQQISEILSTTDRHIEKLDKIIEDYKLLKKGMMQKLLTEGIGHTEFKDSEIGRIPKEWEVKKLGDVTEIVSGGTPKTNIEDYWADGTIYWATPTDITGSRSKYISYTERMISEKGLKSSSSNLLPAGTILMTSRATIGERCINTIPMATNQGFKSFVCKIELLNEYLYYYIDIIKRTLMLNSSGSTFKEISKGKVEVINIAIPEIAEQQHISEFLSTMDRKIEMLQFDREDFIQLKKSLMDKLLTGKVRIG